MNLKLEKKNSSPRKKSYVDYYDDELIEYASRLFKDDIECLGYEFGDVWGTIRARRDAFNKALNEMCLAGRPFWASAEFTQFQFDKYLT